MARSGKVVHFGAGNIGRGFIGPLPHKSGFAVVFADVNSELVNKLNATPAYSILEVGSGGTNRETVTDYRAVNSKLNEAELIEDIATADLVTCSVGPGILESIAPVIAQGIDQRPDDAAPLAVIACENAIRATSTLAEHIKDAKNTSQHQLEDHHHRVRYANSAVDRIVPAQDPNAGLDVTLEQFYDWVVDRKPFAEHGVPAIHGVRWVDDLEPYIERKLYTVNTGHATAAYHGYHCDKRTVYDALQDRFIREQVRRALAHTSRLIVAKHGIPEEEQREYADHIVRRISSPYLEDAVERVGRAPLRKLSRRERFIGPAAELAENGEDYSALLGAAEMAFRFQNVKDDGESMELAKIMAENRPGDVVTKVCGVKSSEKLYSPLVRVVTKVQADMEDSD